MSLQSELSQRPKFLDNRGILHRLIYRRISHYQTMLLATASRSEERSGIKTDQRLKSLDENRFANFEATCRAASRRIFAPNQKLYFITSDARSLRIENRV